MSGDAFRHSMLRSAPTEAVVTRAKQIRALVLDVDGVLTDGHVYMGDDGEAFKAFHILDGKGINLLLRAGIDVALLTARQSELVERRARELGIAHVLQGQQDKRHGFQTLLQRLELSPDEIAYMGDDLVDIPVLRQCGLACTVADGHPLAAEHSHWQSSLGGGRGAVRELCELILGAQGRLQGLFDEYTTV